MIVENVMGLGQHQFRQAKVNRNSNDPAGDSYQPFVRCASHRFFLILCSSQCPHTGLPWFDMHMAPYTIAIPLPPSLQDLFSRRKVFLKESRPPI